MTETLEPLLNMLCKSVTKGQQNAHQTLYLLGDAKGAKLSYDVLIACGLDVKYFADTDEAGGKLYVQNAAIAASGDKISAALAAAPLLKQIKELVDAQSTISNYSITFANTPAGRQLTLLFPSEKTAKSTPSTATKTAPAAAKAASKPSARLVQEAAEEESILTGPSVARKAIPSSFKTSATDEDPLIKRALFYLSSRAFTSVAWSIFFMLILGVVFSIVVTIRGFLCPDIVTDSRSIPAYCPQKITTQQQ